MIKHARISILLDKKSRRYPRRKRKFTPVLYGANGLELARGKRYTRKDAAVRAARAIRIAVRTASYYFFDGAVK